MKKDLKTVKEVCRITGLKRKQLYDYDRLGIIKPASYENEAGYKLYDEEGIRKLKQIILLRELGISRGQIREMINSDESDWEKVLGEHITALEEKKKRLNNMILVARQLQIIGFTGRSIDDFKHHTVDEIADDIRIADYLIEKIEPNLQSEGEQL